MLNNCPDLKQRVQTGQVHQDARGLYFLGPIGSRGPRVYFNRDNPSTNALEAAYKEWAQDRPQPAPMSVLRAQFQERDTRGSLPISMLKVQPRLGRKPELNEEIDDDEEGFAGYVNSVNTRRSQDGVRKRRREQNIASTKHREVGRYMAPSAQVEEIEDEVMMESLPLQENQDPSQTQVRQTAPQVPRTAGEKRNLRQQAARAPLKMNDDLMEALYERFHSRTLEIKVGELLRVAPQLKTKLFRELPEKPEEVVQALQIWQPMPETWVGTKAEEVTLGVSHMGSSRDARKSVRVSGEKRGSPDVYALGLLYTHVYAGEVALKTLIDCGSGVDAMPYSVAQELDLRIRPDPKVKMLPIGGAELKCYGVAEGVVVSIGDIALTINAFVLEMCPTDLLLGRPFMEASKMALVQQEGGHVSCTVHNAARTRRCTFNVFKPSESKVTREERLWGDDSEN